MPSVSRYRTWLAVPADEIEDLKKAHPPMNGHTPVIWDKEHKLCSPARGRTCPGWTAGCPGHRTSP
ncbi:DNA primase [Salmonella enterica subsp. enterica]|uniref:DNA primase n=1 Tax=Salmonella enterica I TaxID=59201 RepID=A0A379W0Z5_SALET|nr:DNA primase [Salmonella enterica subsp. enterica]